VLSLLCEPTLFHTVSLVGRDPAQFATLLEKSSRLACVVRHLKFDLKRELFTQRSEKLSDDGAGILGLCHGIRSLTIFFTEKDDYYPVSLLKAIAALPDLFHLYVEDQEAERHLYRTLDGADREPSTYLLKHLLETVLESHGKQLLSLVVAAATPMAESTLNCIIQNTPKLTKLEIHRCLKARLRSVLANSGTWACAPHLGQLKFKYCTGVHAGTFTRMLALGVFGCPRWVSLIGCGHPISDDRSPPPPHLEWRIPPLEVLELYNFDRWEMAHLCMIHTREVHMSKVWSNWVEPMKIEDVRSMVNASSFPELVLVNVTSEWSKQEFSELQQVCQARGIESVTVGSVYSGRF